MTVKDICLHEDVPLLLKNRFKVTTGLRHTKKDGSIIDMEITSHSLTFAGRPAAVILANGITERRKTEERLEKLNKCFLRFGVDPIENINRLTALCGELMGATCALYNRLNRGMLCSLGRWNMPPGYNPVNEPEGHICYDVINHGGDEVLVIRNLPKTRYAHADSNVKAYNLKTYVGRAVKFGEEYVGSLCVVYQKDVIPSEADKRLMELIASAVGVEENRMGAKEALKRSKDFTETVLNSINDAISIIDTHDFRIIDANQAFFNGHDLKKEEVIGKRCYEVLHEGSEPCTPPDTLCPLQNSLKSGKPSIFEQVHYIKDGSAQYVEVSVSPIKNEKGEIIHVRLC